MQLIVIHGNGLSAISQKVSEIKKGFDNVSTTEINSKERDFDQAVVAVATPSLFSEKRLVVLEDFEKIDASKLPADGDLTVVLRFSKQLPATSGILKQKGQIINLSERDEKNIFPFLDKLADKNQDAAVEIDKFLEGFGGQYLLTMIFYLLRRMVQTTKPGFMAGKIEKQKKNFPLERIKTLYKDSLETDFKIKSGLIEEKLGLTLLVNKFLT